MLKNKKISIAVVIPAKNRESTLIACIDSVLAQSFQVDEVIAVDDHSTDGTKTLIDHHPDPRVKYLSLPDHLFGAQAARNYGIQMASSSWIAFQDSDDVWIKNKLEQQVAVLEGLDFDEMVVVHGDCIKQDVESKNQILFEPPLMNGNCYKELLIGPSPLFPSILASKRALRSIGGLDDQCPAYQEWDTSIRLSKVCNFIHLRTPLFYWKVHKIDSISKSKSKDIFGFNYVIEAHKDEIIFNHGIREWRKLKISNALRALKYGLWNEAKTSLDGVGKIPAAILIIFLASIKLYPRGIGRFVL